MSWFSRCSWCGGPFNGGNCRHCTNVSFGDEPVYDSNPNSYNQTPDISNPHSQPLTSSFNQFHCFHCKDPLEDGVRCQRCTCVRCGHYLGDGFCSFCNSEAGNSFVNDSNPNSFNDPPNVFTHPPQPQYESYSKFYVGRTMLIGYDWLPRVRLSDEQERATIKTLMNDVLKAVQSLVEKLCQQEQAANLSTHTPEPSRHFNSICYDDEESTIPLNEIISQIPLSVAITPVLLTMEPEDFSYRG
ncbi:hypothetical protein Tco_1263250 [Tanacetum coccineum]